MARIVQLSEASSLALHAMIYLATEERASISVKECSAALGASEAHMAKVVQHLSKAGLVNTTRGAKGGVSLARRPEEITYLEIYEVMEGRLVSERCLLRDEGKCPFASCIFGDALEKMAGEIRQKFAETYLSDNLRA